MKYKKWVISTLIVAIVCLFVCGTLIVIVDPYFHYHKPLSCLQYEIDNERYQNNGIVKHFDYNAIITGTSMTENFKTSEVDSLWNVQSIKVPIAAATLKEVNDQLEIAFKHNNNIKLVIRGIDFNRIIMPADAMQYEESFYPNYLYDDKILNDVSYVFNKEVLTKSLQTIEYTWVGGLTTSFDKYANWNDAYDFGREAILKTNSKPETKDDIVSFSETDRRNVKENIEQNVLNLALENPDTDFYFFITPYSILSFDAMYRAGILEQYLEAQKLSFELLLNYRNIHVFSFFDEYELICDLNNYRDGGHYSEDINSWILQCMSDGSHEITIDNYLDYCDEIKEFYFSFNYDSIWE